jgi:pimeloyl-ACP methyl ester carboxylesterase
MVSRRWAAGGLVAMGAAAVLSACGSSPAGGAKRQAGPPSVVTAAVSTVQTKLGMVGYRELGSGPPLVLIMGYAGTMEIWDPRFVDALARRYTVVTFDNAGIGYTQALPSPLTIDAMARQTSALIEALGLRRPYVLGWSMGGMIAQALAVEHPAQVRRLVLAASFPAGPGMAIPSQQAVRALTSGNAKAASADLYPADQALASGAFTVDLSGYPAASPAPTAIVSAQAKASLEWFHGTDPLSKRTATISAPTLVADGTLDRLDAVANDHLLAARIPGARLVLYPDAGHAFLFQEGAAFVSVVESFLSGAPAPATISAIRRGFKAGVAAVEAAGKRWVAKLHAVGAHPSPGQVAGIDEGFASAQTRLDAQLLGYGATGRVGAAIAAVVHAGESVANDIIALTVQTSESHWAAILTRDSKALQAAEAALRKALGLPPARAGATGATGA